MCPKPMCRNLNLSKIASIFLSDCIIPLFKKDLILIHVMWLKNKLIPEFETII